MTRYCSLSAVAHRGRTRLGGVDTLFQSAVGDNGGARSQGRPAVLGHDPIGREDRPSAVSIPDKIGFMGQLESLDVSKNILSSIIPSSISTLEYLSILNLSYNNLIGKIPSQMQTFTNLSYISNPELCGESHQNKCMEGHSTINGRVIEEDMHEDDEYGGIWYFISLAPGFVFGF
ncbi:hypothetical protein ZIOFF_051065 [Zingiber officinale]|uniref:Uncharacterized protein n=1 Tax=Zingiber officinale TaxID=94328 RepID=A0A8J5FQT6_ZINOF|nr:hypothetical protein ZIOFF_051065 [Zingiber officinale]